jgi:hypothetical protein
MSPYLQAVGFCASDTTKVISSNVLKQDRALIARPSSLSARTISPTGLNSTTDEISWPEQPQPSRPYSHEAKVTPLFGELSGHNPPRTRRWPYVGRQVV